jgi:hypothetical protein
VSGHAAAAPPRSAPPQYDQLTSERHVLLSLSETYALKVASRWMIANIASDDAPILPQRANPAGLNFWETTS